MLFNSIQFLIFFPVVTFLYFITPQKYRWALLLTASCYFYMSFIPVYILILLVTIVIDYYSGIYIEKAEGKKKKKYLIISIISLILVLFIFKYFNFFNHNLAAIYQKFSLNYPVQDIGLILPIGLSFHTFQSLSYVIEVYKGRQKTEHHFGIYSLYVMFYPQLVAGPIERPQNLLHQFYEKHNIDYKRITGGLKLMTWGMFKKVVIADRLAVLVNQVYDNPLDYKGISLIIATVFFAIQIYCDFSGYSDIAIGAAHVMGFKLMKNFDRPYFSKSIPEFWKRWNISLSSWFRDYLYFPIGGSRVPVPRWYFNLLFTFVVSGLWHGASWNFLIWGALNGVYIIASISTKSLRENIVRLTRIGRLPMIHKIFQVLCVFSLISFSVIFFRSDSLKTAMYIIKNIFPLGDFSTMFSTGIGHSIFLDNSMYDFTVAAALIILLKSVEMIQRKGSIIEMLDKKSFVIRWAAYYIILILILLLGQFQSSVQFIYFQF